MVGDSDSLKNMKVVEICFNTNFSIYLRDGKTCTVHI